MMVFYVILDIHIILICIIYIYIHALYIYIHSIYIYIYTIYIYLYAHPLDHIYLQGFTMNNRPTGLAFRFSRNRWSDSSRSRTARGDPRGGPWTWHSSNPLAPSRRSMGEIHRKIHRKMGKAMEKWWGNDGKIAGWSIPIAMVVMENTWG
jgi:hypothetical protein